MTRPRANAGFTLVEMLAVMLIIAGMAGLAIAYAPGTGRPRLKAVAMDVAALLRRERLSAMLSGRARHVGLDRRRRALVGESGGEALVPADVTLDLLGPAGDYGVLQAVTEFAPDGASTGAALAFSRERMRYEVRVDWFTGGVSIDAR